jgi:hypothetical protein
LVEALGLARMLAEDVLKDAAVARVISDAHTPWAVRDAIAELAAMCAIKQALAPRASSILARCSEPSLISLRSQRNPS